jgi:hypothetical protein
MKAKIKAAFPSRIAGILKDEEEDLSGFPEPPKDEKEREEYWNDTIFDTIAALRSMLRSKDQQISLTAAQEILALSRTRMRHGKRIDGTGDGSMTYEESEEKLDRTIGRNRMSDSDCAAAMASAASKNEDRPKPGLQRNQGEDLRKPEPQQNQLKEDEVFEEHVILVRIASEQIAKDLKIQPWQTLTREQAAMIARSILKNEGSTAVEMSESRMHRLVQMSMFEFKQLNEAEERKKEASRVGHEPE